MGTGHRKISNTYDNYVYWYIYRESELNSTQMSEKQEQDCTRAYYTVSMLVLLLLLMMHSSQRTPTLLSICISHTVSFPKKINSKQTFCAGNEIRAAGNSPFFCFLLYDYVTFAPEKILNYFKWPFLLSNPQKMLILMNFPLHMTKNKHTNVHFMA